MNDTELPQGWTWATLDNLRDPAAPIVYGIILPGDDIHDGVPYLRPVDILDSGGIDFSSVKRTTPAIAAKYARASIQAGDIVLSIVGTIGKVCVVPPALNGGNITQSSVRIRTANQLSASYLRWALLSPQLRIQYDRHRFGNAVQRLNVAHARNLLVPIAPRAEQDRIAAAIEQHLSDIDAGIATLERVLANLKRYRAAVLKAACEGRLVPTEAELARKERRDYEPADVLLKRILVERRAHWEAEQLAKMKAKGQTPRDDKWKAKYEEPKPLESERLQTTPQGWCWTTLKTLADIKGGVTKGQKRRPDEVLRAVPYLRVANVQRGSLDLSEMKEIAVTDEEIRELQLRRGDVLFNEGGDRDKLGRGWIWEEQLPLCIHQNHVFRARLPVHLVIPKFISWYGNSFGQKYFVDEGKQTTNLASINMTKLGALPVPLPPLAEQYRIVSEVERLFSVADVAERAVSAQLVRAAHLRQSVLKLAFEGKLIPQNPKDEPASALLARIQAGRGLVEKPKTPARPRARIA